MNVLDNTLLTQLYNENRYYKQFHHFLFTFTTTLLSTMLTLQVASPDIFLRINGVVYLLFGTMLFVGFPIVIVRFIASYHNKIARISIAISSIIQHYMAKKGEGEAIKSLSPEIQDVVTQYKYYKLGDKRSFFWNGGGHKLFVLCILVLAAANIAMLIYIFLHVNSIS